MCKTRFEDDGIDGIDLNKQTRLGVNFEGVVNINRHWLIAKLKSLISKHKKCYNYHKIGFKSMKPPSSHRNSNNRSINVMFSHAKYKYENKEEIEIRDVSSYGKNSNEQEIKKTMFPVSVKNIRMNRRSRNAVFSIKQKICEWRTDWETGYTFYGKTRVDKRARNEMFPFTEKKYMNEQEIEKCNVFTYKEIMRMKKKTKTRYFLLKKKTCKWKESVKRDVFLSLKEKHEI